VAGWHARSACPGRGADLAEIVTRILTESVTRTLPPSWAGPYSVERARQWIARRDAEGPVLLAVDRGTGEPAGLVILFEIESDAGIEVRIGYLLTESFWGLGLATELVEGFVQWCRGRSRIHSLAAGVARDHPASRRVLEKAGFRPGTEPGETAGEEEILTLEFGNRTPTSPAPPT